MNLSSPLHSRLAPFLAAMAFFVLPSISTAQIPAGSTVNQVDFVFLIDASPSMSNNIGAVRAGMSQFVTDLTNNSVDAEFAMVLFGKSGPELVLDLTADTAVVLQAFDDINVNGAAVGFHDTHNGDPEDGLAAIRAALGATNTVLNHVHVGGNGIIDFRVGSLINLILMTDENSDRPFYANDQLAGQTQTEPFTTEATFQASDWQVEVDNTAAAVIASGAFLNMLIDPVTASKLQYGDPSADVSDPDLLNFDEDATLVNLNDGASTSEQSLQTQVLTAGLVARTFTIGSVADETYVSNFFAAKLQETLLPVCGDGAVEGDEECDDSNTVDGDCCSGSCAYEAVAAPCTDDADACTTDECDATGTCEHNAITCAADGDDCTADTCDAVAGCNYPSEVDTTPCDDGLFCTTTDTCTGGVCGGVGDPCSAGAECQTTCNEEGGGFNCNDAADVPCTSDADICTDDLCDGAGACGHANNTAPCDDGDGCTDGDACLNGACEAGGGVTDCSDGSDCTIDSCVSPGGCEYENIQFFSACFGAIIAGNTDKPGQARIRNSVLVDGNVCGDKGDVGVESVTEGSWYILDAATPKAVKVRGNDAVVGGDFATAGGGLIGAPKKKVNDLFQTGIASFIAGATAPMAGGGSVDTTGTDATLADCLAAQENQAPIAQALDGLPVHTSIAGKLETPANGTETFVAANVGSINVVEIGSKWSIGNFGTVVIDGGDPTEIAETSFVFIIDKKLDSDATVQWDFVNGAAPERTVFYVRGGKLEIGQNNTGGGVLFCPNGKIKMRSGTIWSGVLVAGKKIDVIDSAVIDHVHYTGPNF
jgi:hypothetical protein